MTTADGRAHFPRDGVELRGRSVNSVAVWLVGTCASAVAASDLAVVGQWILRGQPVTPLFVAAAVVMVAATALLSVLLVLARRTVRRQCYRISPAGLNVPWHTTGPDLVLPWLEILAIERQYESAPAARTMGVAIYVERSERFSQGPRPVGSPARRAADHLARYDTPIYLDLTDVPGGTLRFFAAIRHYGRGRARRDLVIK